MRESLRASAYLSGCIRSTPNPTMTSNDQASDPHAARDARRALDVAPADKSLPSHCGNCGAELLGPHCHACGQPTKGLVRHFSSIVGDFFDSVFDLDSRL